MDITDMVKPSLIQRQKRRDKRMHEEVIEVGRIHGGKKGKILREQGYKAFYAKNFPDSYPVNVSIAPKGSSTYFDDNLGLLKKFLMTKVGQKWDEVFAELNGKLDSRSLQGLHIIGHVFDFVEIHVKIQDGYFIRQSNWGHIYIYDPKTDTNEYRSRYFYVHPETGILTRWREPKKIACPKKARFKKEKEKRKWKMRAEKKTDKTPPNVFGIKKEETHKNRWWRKATPPPIVEEPVKSEKEKRSEKWFNEHQAELNMLENQKPKIAEKQLRLLFVRPTWAITWWFKSTIHPDRGKY